MKLSSIEIGARIEAGAAQLRTLESMLADMRNSAPLAPEALAQGRQKPFLPTMPADQYADLKTGLHAEGPVADKPQLAQAEAAHAEAQPRATVIQVGPNMPGAMNVDGLTPPDTEATR